MKINRWETESIEPPETLIEWKAALVELESKIKDKRFVDSAKLYYYEGELFLRYQREETDAEAERRINQEAELRRQQEGREYKEYLRLKEKFEVNS